MMNSESARQRQKVAAAVRLIPSLNNVARFLGLLSGDVLMIARNSSSEVSSAPTDSSFSATRQSFAQVVSDLGVRARLVK